MSIKRNRGKLELGQGKQIDVMESIKIEREKLKAERAKLKQEMDSFNIERAINAFEEGRWYEGLSFAEKTDMKNARIQYWMGLFYTAGFYCQRDKEQAEEWFSLAAEQGHKEAKRSLKFIRKLSSDGAFLPDAHEYVAKNRCLEAAERGEIESQANWGTILYLCEHEDEGLEWLRKAADKDNCKAQCVLGDAYENGNGVKKDIDEALKWYRAAANGGNRRAEQKLENELNVKYEKHKPTQHELLVDYVIGEDGLYHKRVKTGSWLPMPPNLPYDMWRSMYDLHCIGMKSMPKESRTRCLCLKIFGNEGPEHEGYGTGELQRWADAQVSKGGNPYHIDLRQWFKGAVDAFDRGVLRYSCLKRSFAEWLDDPHRESDDETQQYILEKVSKRLSFVEQFEIPKDKFCELVKQKYYTISYAPYGIIEMRDFD